MNLAIFSALLFFVGSACSGPNPNKLLSIDSQLFSDRCSVLYTSENDIINIVAFESAKYNFDDELFFVEKDKGLFVYKDNQATKLLTTGRDIAVAAKNNKKVYFAASDGIYIYNLNQNKADKYGTVTDDLINIVVDSTGDVIYILTKSKELFKVTNNGAEKVKSDVLNAAQIIMDQNNNLYYYTTEKDVYVRNEGGVKKMEGLPNNPNKLTLLEPPSDVNDGVPILVDNKAYMIFANGTIATSDFKIGENTTAYSMQKEISHYFAYNKKIYVCRRQMQCLFKADFVCKFIYAKP